MDFMNEYIEKEQREIAANMERYAEGQFRRVIREELDRDVGAKSNPIIDAERAVIEAAKAWSDHWRTKFPGQASGPLASNIDNALDALRAARNAATSPEGLAAELFGISAAILNKPPENVTATSLSAAGTIPPMSTPTARGSLPTRAEWINVVRRVFPRFMEPDGDARVADGLREWIAPRIAELERERDQYRDEWSRRGEAEHARLRLELKDARAQIAFFLIPCGLRSTDTNGVAMSFNSDKMRDLWIKMYLEGASHAALTPQPTP